MKNCIKIVACVLAMISYRAVAQESCPDKFATTDSSDPCNSKLNGCSGGCNTYVSNVPVYCAQDTPEGCDSCHSVPCNPTVLIKKLYEGNCQANIKNGAFCSCDNAQYLGDTNPQTITSYNVTDSCGCYDNYVNIKHKAGEALLAKRMEKQKTNPVKS
jgi:hypothetical protein